MCVIDNTHCVGLVIFLVGVKREEDISAYDCIIIFIYSFKNLILLLLINLLAFKMAYRHR